MGVQGKYIVTLRYEPLPNSLHVRLNGVTQREAPPDESQ